MKPSNRIPNYLLFISLISSLTSCGVSEQNVVDSTNIKDIVTDINVSKDTPLQKEKATIKEISSDDNSIEKNDIKVTTDTNKTVIEKEKDNTDFIIVNQDHIGGVEENFDKTDEKPITDADSSTDKVDKEPDVVNIVNGENIVVGGDTNTPTKEDPVVVPSIVQKEIPDSAFNIYSNEAFSASTCKIIPLETPSGYFASINGKSSASGTFEDPLDLTKALSDNSPLNAGDTLWIKEGTYSGSYVSKLRGTSVNPIQVKPIPGKRVIIDNTSGSSSGLQVSGIWSEFYGLEVLSKQLDRDTPADKYADIEFPITGGVSVGGSGSGSNTKVINFIVHDNVGGGISSWSDAPDSELYGNIIYNNGWTSPKRGHGHAIYAQNRTGYKKLTNNIIFFGFGTGIHVYTQGGQIEGFDVEDNVWFMTGASDPRASQRKDNCLIGGFQPVKRLTLKNNLGFSLNSRGTRIGYGGSVVGQDAILDNNYLSENFWVAGYWDSLDIQKTTVLRGTTGSRQDQVNDLGDNLFLDTPPTSGKKIVVSANKYDKRRARVVIYNNDEDSEVSVDLSSVLKIGEVYRIHSSFGLFDVPLVKGVYDGSLVSIPMDKVEPPQPNGIDGIEEIDKPHKKFEVFLVTHALCE